MAGSFDASDAPHPAGPLTTRVLHDCGLGAGIERCARPPHKPACGDEARQLSRHERTRIDSVPSARAPGTLVRAQPPLPPAHLQRAVSATRTDLVRHALYWHRPRPQGGVGGACGLGALGPGTTCTTEGPDRAASTAGCILEHTSWCHPAPQEPRRSPGRRPLAGAPARSPGRSGDRGHAY